MAPRKSPEKNFSRTTPLWIIGLFVGMSELVAATTVINTTGLVQIISVIFMCIFTSGVASAFFYTLWTRNEVLFPPSEFSGIDIEQYVRNVSGRHLNREKTIVNQITNKIESEIKSITDREDKSVRLISAIKSVRNDFVEIVFPAPKFISGPDLSFELYASGWESVTDFLNEIYVAATLNGAKVPIWTYGKYWVLKNRSTNKYIEKISDVEGYDKRPFSELNIAPGDTLVAELI